MQLPGHAGGAAHRAAILDGAVAAFRSLHLRLSTRRTYSGHQRRFLAFAASVGADASIPFTEHLLCQAAVAFAARASVRSLPQYFSAVSKLHIELGFGPLPRNEAFKQTIKGLNNFFGQHDATKPKTALSIENLNDIFARLDLSRFDHARLWAMLLCGFFGLLRISEYCDGALTQQSVRTTVDGIILTLPFSKTSLTPVDVRIAVRPDNLCARAAYLHYRSFLAGAALSSTAPAFVATANSAKPFSRAHFTLHFKAIAQQLGLDPSRYAGHSLRRGGCTAMFLAGVAEAMIAAHGRWRSAAFRQYLDFVQDVQWSPTRTLAAAGRLPTREEAARLVRLNF